MPRGTEAGPRDAASAALVALEKLPENQQKFVEGIVAGMNGVEAVKFSGSRGGRAHLASQASRWRRLPQIEDAIAALRKAHEIDAEDLWTMTMKALRELIQDRSNPNARARACELMAKLLGKLQPETHQHLHAHVEVPQLSEPESREEMIRLVRITLDAMPEAERAVFVREAMELKATPVLPEEVTDG